MENSFTLSGNIVDILQQTIQPGTITIHNGKIAQITTTTGPANPTAPYITPGFIDAHVHIESSMLVPAEFARLAVVHGTVATVSDPHEIANVCGIAGIEYMITNGQQVPFKFNFGAPSCVPATAFETAGAVLDVAAVTALLARPDIKYLSEMMNFPGVLHNDPEVMQKIKAAIDAGKPIDGHAPGLTGDLARQYAAAGITTDHECFTAAEAQEKLNLGMHILIREGSAAKNFDALIPLLPANAEKMMFCSDDKHPDSLVEGHINQLCARAVATGIDPFKVLQAACINPVLHYKLDVGLLREGDPADFILLKDLTTFTVQQTYINGQLVASKGQSHIQSTTTEVINQFNRSPKQPEAFQYPLQKWGPEEPENFEQVRVIEALDGQLITNKRIVPITDLKVANNLLHSNTEKDILKIVVVNRYHTAPVAKSFIKNFGLKTGAIASSIAHDSHNIIAIGVDDDSICAAINLIITQKGGISCVNGTEQQVLPLPVAGLMSPNDGYAIAKAYTKLDSMAKALGSQLSAPFMTLSFMALLVIPHLKLSDKGLFDGDAFKIC